jgi:hypothetical protein
VENKIPQNLTFRAQQNAMKIVQAHDANECEENVTLFAKLSVPIQMEIHLAMHSPYLDIHPFFKRYSVINDPAARKICHSAIVQLTLAKDDILFTIGEVVEHPQMFVVKLGHFKYVKAFASNNSCTAVQGGEWVCEPCLWTEWSTFGTMIATSNSELVCLDAPTFGKIALQFPSGKNYCTEYAVLLVNSLNQIDRDELTDFTMATLNGGSVDADLLAFQVFGEMEKKSTRRLSALSFSTQRSFSSSANGLRLQRRKFINLFRAT